MALFVIGAWLITGPVFGYSDTWQLIINTGTTIVTFLMVFLIQHTQNRDSEELHLKIDELIRAKLHASNEMLCLDELDDDDLNELKNMYARMAHKKEFTSNSSNK